LKYTQFAILLVSALYLSAYTPYNRGAVFLIIAVMNQDSSIMKIGIVADTHNNVENTQQAVDILKAEKVDRVIHCGDITTPQIIEVFTGMQAVFVFGNIDHSHADLMAKAKELMGMGSIGYSYTAVWEDLRIAVIHGDDSRLDEMVHSGRYDYVFHGHTHQRRDERVGDTRVINPGALGGSKKETRSLCILNTETGEAVFHEIEGD
jgi:hypothetical protein